MRRLAAFGVAGALLAGCGGGGGDAHAILSRTAVKLGTIHSGTIRFDLQVKPSGGAGHVPFGFRVTGPFALRPGGLPTADVRYTQRASGKSATVGLISTRRQGDVSVGGE